MSPQHMEQMARDALDEARSLEQLRLFEQVSRKSLHGKRIMKDAIVSWVEEGQFLSTRGRVR